MKILVTGAGGQVGLELLAELVNRGHEVFAADVRERPDCVPAAAADVRWFRDDVSDGPTTTALLEHLRPEVVFHLAAILSATGEQMPQLAYAVNQTGTYNLFEACRITGVRQFIYTSTIAAFGPGLPQPVANTVPMRPTTMYGVTKVAGELLGAYYEQKFGLDFRGVRFPGLINAGIPGGGTSDYALFMYVNGIRDGHYASFSEERAKIPFMYMPDAIRALIEISEADKDRLTDHVYNIAAMSPTALEIAESVRAAVPGVELTFEPDPARQGILDSWPQALDDSLARHDWDWKHEYDLDAMTADLVPKVREMLAG